MDTFVSMRQRVPWVVLIVCSASISSCGSADVSDDGLRFRFLPGEEVGVISQQLVMANDSDHGQAMKLQITAEDEEGNVMPRVRVHTAFGSDVGGLAIGAHSTAFDVLRFSGPGFRGVADVNVRVVSTRAVAAVPREDIDFIFSREGPDGAPTESGTPTRAVTLANPSRQKVRLRVVGLEYEDVSDREFHQQFIQRIVAGKPVILEPGAKTRVRLPRVVYGSVKAFQTP